MALTLGTTYLLTRAGWGRYEAVAHQMRSQGWEGLLFQKHFMPGCLMNDECKEKLWAALTQGIPLWVPWLPLGMLMVAGLFKPSAQVRRKNPGQALWADRKSLSAYLEGGPKEDPLNPRRGYAGVFIERGKVSILRPPLRDKCGHSWVIAGTGGGKSSRYLKPLHALSALEGSSCITLDLKYPDLESGLLDCTIPYLKEGHPVQVFTPYEEHSARIDLFAYARTLGEAGLLAEAFIPQGNEMTEFYKAQGRNLLKALFYAAAHALTPPTPRKLYLTVRRGPGAVGDFMMTECPEAFEECKSFFLLKEAEQINLLANLGSELELFSNEQVSRAFTRVEGEMIDPALPLLKCGMLYIGVSLYEAQSVAGQRLIQILVRLLHATIDRTAKGFNNRLPVHVNFNLDEFGNMPPLPYIGERFATMRSFGLSYNICLQNLTQGEAVYGRLEFKAGTDNNITHRLYIPASLKDGYTREQLSKEIGRASYQDESRNDSKGSFFSLGDARSGLTRREIALDLVSPAEMLRWDREAGIMFVVSGPQAKVALPRMDQASFQWEGRRIKNPIHFLHKRYFAGTDVDAITARLTGRSGSSRAKVDRSSGATPSLDPTAQVHPVTAFVAWMNALLEQGETVYLYEGDRERIYVKSENLGKLEPELRFFELGWLNRDSGKLTWTDLGRKLVGENLRVQMRAQKTLQKIKVYLRDFADSIAGLGEQDPAKPEAILNKDSLWITPTGLLRIFGKQMPQLEEHKRAGIRYKVLPLEPAALVAVLSNHEEAEAKQSAEPNAQRSEQTKTSDPQTPNGTPAEATDTEGKTSTESKRRKKAKPGSDQSVHTNPPNDAEISAGNPHKMPTRSRSQGPLWDQTHPNPLEQTPEDLEKKSEPADHDAPPTRDDLEQPNSSSASNPDPRDALESE